MEIRVHSGEMPRFTQSNARQTSIGMVMLHVAVTVGDVNSTILETNGASKASELSSKLHTGAGSSIASGTTKCTRHNTLLSWSASFLQCLWQFIPRGPTSTRAKSRTPWAMLLFGNRQLNVSVTQPRYWDSSSNSTSKRERPTP
jgi:hypothetical protein